MLTGLWEKCRGERRLNLLRKTNDGARSYRRQQEIESIACFRKKEASSSRKERIVFYREMCLREEEI